MVFRSLKRLSLLSELSNPLSRPFSIQIHSTRSSPLNFSLGFGGELGRASALCLGDNSLFDLSPKSSPGEPEKINRKKKPDVLSGGLSLTLLP